jgi:hypothetical protein
MNATRYPFSSINALWQQLQVVLDELDRQVVPVIGTVWVDEIQPVASSVEDFVATLVEKVQVEFHHLVQPRSGVEGA